MQGEIKKEIAGVEGGLLSQCRNRFSGLVYNVSTIPQPSDDAWTTVIFACVEKRCYFGLVRKYVPDFSGMLRTYIRNTKSEAYEVHEQVSKMVATEKQDDWASVEPDTMPPDGFSEAAERRLAAQWGSSLSPEIRARFRKRK